MPLPPLPAHNTPRYKLLYTTLLGAHSITVHMPPTGTAADATAYGLALANLLKPVLLSNCQFTGVQYAEQGSDIFNDVSALSIAGTAGTNENAQLRPMYINFAGRAPSARKTRIFLFGAQTYGDGNWRITRQEVPAVATIVDGLNSGTGNVRTIDGQVPIFKPYANVGAHDRYVKRIRRAG